MRQAKQPLIGPQVRYPTPWDWAIAADAPAALVLRAADLTATAVVYEKDVAELIVRLVNREADPGMVNLLEANEALQELAGQLAEAHAEIERLRTLGAGVVELDPSQIPHTWRVSDVQRVFRAAGLRLQFEVDEKTHDAAAEGSQP